jgi:hypothetical protein
MTVEYRSRLRRGCSDDGYLPDLIAELDQHPKTDKLTLLTIERSKTAASSGTMFKRRFKPFKGIETHRHLLGFQSMN